MELDLTIPQLCGQLLVGGFAGHDLPAVYADALRDGRRAGAILFSRNVGGLDGVAALNPAIVAAAGSVAPPVIAVDQEGGRVRRFREPLLPVPPMRVLGEADDLSLTERVAAQMARELRALGFNLDFAPVMDVDSNPDNPVIGDRSFGRDPRTVMRHGVAFIRGLQGEGVIGCAKHFPGHGDTSVDSHLELPVIAHPAERLRQVELPPFRAAVGAGVGAMMTAHVVCEALDPGIVATMSRAICTSLLRREMAFDGALFSDDLEMGAIADRYGIEEAAREAVAAGCDLLLVCSDFDAQERAHAALVARCEAEPRFLERCREAAGRSLALRRLVPPAVATAVERDRFIAGGEGLARELAAIGGNAAGSDPTERA